MRAILGLILRESSEVSISAYLHLCMQLSLQLLLMLLFLPAAISNCLHVQAVPSCILQMTCKRSIVWWHWNRSDKDVECQIP